MASAFRLHESVHRFLEPLALAAQDEALASLHALERYLARDARARALLQDERHELGERLRLLERGGFLAVPSVAALLRALLAAGALGKLAAFIKEAKRLREREGAAKEAVLVSAVPLTASEKRKIVAALERRWGMHVLIHEEIDPQAIGGFRVLADGWFFDATVQGRAERCVRALAPSS